MARIPVLTRRQQLPSTTGVPANPVVLMDDKSGEALTNTGALISEIGERHLRAQADAMVTQSFVNAQLKLDELKQKIDTDQILSWDSNNPNATAPSADVDEIEDRMRQIYQSASQGLSPYGQRRFEKDFATLAAKSRIEINREKVKRDNAQITAHGIKLLDVLRRGATADGTEIGWNLNLKVGIDKIDSLELNGQIGSIKAEKLRQNFRKNMDNIKGDRLLVNVEMAFQNGLNEADIDEEPEAAKIRLKKLKNTLNEAIKFGSLSRKSATLKENDFLRLIDESIAEQQITRNPKTFLEKRKDPNYLSNLDSKTKSRLTKRAEDNVERDRKNLERERRAEERKFIMNIENTFKDLATGANLSPDLKNSITDTSIETNISDSNLANQFKEKRDVVVAGVELQNQIRGMPREQILARLKEIQNESKQEITIPGMGELQRVLINNFQEIIKKDLQMRNKDSAGYVVNYIPHVQSAFSLFQQAIDNGLPDDEVAKSYLSYAASRNSAFADIGIDITQRRKFPKQFLEREVAFFQDSLSSPELIANRFDKLTEFAGTNDGGHILNELMQIGLPEEIAVFAVTEDPRSLQIMASIVKNGLSEYESQFEKGTVSEVKNKIQEEMQSVFRIAGINNIAMTSAQTLAMKILSLNNIRNNMSINRAVEAAYDTIIDNNFDVIELNNIKGIIPKDVIQSDRALFAQLNDWLNDDKNLQNLNTDTLNVLPENAQTFVRNNANWILTPDGKSAQLFADKETPVIDSSNNAIFVKIEDLKPIVDPSSEYAKKFGGMRDVGMEVRLNLKEPNIEKTISFENELF